MEHFFNQGWEITPAGGATGEAFFAQYEQEKLFLKRNSSPFLAVLSAEGIVPKLIWTKRMESGDVITAQKWLKGRELRPQEMNDEQVSKLLKKIHQSQPLLTMLERLGKVPLYPQQIAADLEIKLDEELLAYSIIKTALQYLHANIREVTTEELAVCHCDVNHNNWLLSEAGKLYLIDWDGAMIADPAIDLGPLLYFYVEQSRWNNWLKNYGLYLDDTLKLRMKWYVVAQVVDFILWNRQQNRITDQDYWLNYLKTIL